MVELEGLTEVLEECPLKDFKREDLSFSLCGLNCRLCPMFLYHYCPGCGGGEGNQACGAAKCSLQHGKLEYCHLCGEFPCERYDRIDEYDSFITHRNRRKDMERFQKIGSEAYHSEQVQKAEILSFLLKNYNDGRRKSFFCLAVNLLDLEDIKAVSYTHLSMNIPRFGQTIRKNLSGNFQGNL